MAVITISRQFGSGGDEIADRLCHMLNYTYFDKRLLSREASAVGLSEAEVVDAWEDNYKVGRMFDRLFPKNVERAAAGPTTRTWHETTTGVVAPEVVKVDFDQAQRFVQRTIETAYERGEIVIVGRGGQAILRDRPGVLHVRVEAPMLVRVAKVQQAGHLGTAPAQALIEQKDKAAAEYLRHYHGVDWADPALYHLIVNAARWDVESAARLIADAAERLPA
jgi:cytidylate kinase